MVKNIKMVSGLVVGFVVAVLAIGSYIKWFKDPVLCRLGEYEIRQSDADIREKIERVFYPHQPERTGFSELKKYFAYAEILKKYGKAISPEKLKNTKSNLISKSMIL